MRKIRAFTAAAVALFLVFSLTGCSFRFSSFDDLLRPPKISGKYEGLQESFENEAEGSYTLCSPENGDYRSAFITVDIDSDSEEEAFVFSKKKKI